MRPRSADWAGAILAIALALAVPAAGGPPPPPGGHIPVYLGGANQGGYPPVGAGISDPALEQAPGLGEVSSAPNPFRGETVIRFTLGAGGEARLRIFDLAGRRVREIAHRAGQAGYQALEWDGRDDAGKPLASGVYFYQLAAGGQEVTRRLVLLR